MNNNKKKNQNIYNIQFNSYIIKRGKTKAY